MKIVLLLMIISFGFFNHGKKSSMRKQCSSNPKFGSLSYKLFGVRTLYRNSPHPKAHFSHDKKWSNRTFPLSTCTPVYMYLVLRHGARYPASGSLRAQNKLKNLLELVNSTGKASLCDQDIQNLRDWEPWVDVYVNQNQTEYGNEEIRAIAERYMKMIPEIFPPKANPQNYRFFTSNYQRTIASMNVFAKEVLKNNRTDEEMITAAEQTIKQIIPVAGDTLIRFAKNCQAYREKIHNNASRFIEFNDFLQGSAGQLILRAVAKRLGISKKYLTPDLIYSMYFDGCALQQWVDTINGPWCRVFSKKNLKSLDYASDLKEFGLRNNKIVSNMSCNLAKDVVTTLKSIVEAERDGRHHQSGTFVFGHVTTVLSLIANMQFHQDPATPLTAKNYDQNRQRSYRLGNMMPSAGNLAIILYKCGTNYKVQPLWNERAIFFSFCDGLVCSITKFLKIQGQFVRGSSNECDFDRICSL